MIARTLQITGGGAGLAALSGSLPPWGVVLLGVLGAVVAILALLMPQQSPDRLEWWRALFRGPPPRAWRALPRLGVLAHEHRPTSTCVER